MAQSTEDILEKILSRKVTFTDNGKSSKITLMEAIALGTVKKAINGDAKSFAHITNLLKSSPKNQSKREKNLIKQVEELQTRINEIMKPMTESEKSTKILELYKKARERFEAKIRYEESQASINGGLYHI